MSELKLCRICLNKDLKLFSLEQCNLKQYYEEITRNKVPLKDELPQHFCYECAALLYKFHKFKEKCDYGQSTLKKLMASGFMTYYVIEDIRKNRSDLQTSLDYINSYACGKRIKTVNIKYTEPVEMENVIVNSLLDDEDIKYDLIPESDHDSDFTDNILKSEKQEILEIESDSIIESNPETGLKKTNTDLSNPDSTKSNTVFTHTKSDFTEINPILTEPNPDFPIIEHSPSKNDLILKNLLYNSDKDDSSNDVSDSMDTDDDIVEEDESKNNIKYNQNKESKKSDGNKARKGSNPKFYGIIKEPRGELSKGNWETKLLTEKEAMEQFKKREFESKYERLEFKCTKCYKGFSKDDMLLRHNLMWHDKGDKKCKFCQMQFPKKSDLQRHLVHHYYIYKCLRCGLEFFLKNMAVCHDGHHNGVIHKCKHCGEEYTHISSYYTHLRTKHRSAHACALCGETFVSPTGVRFHMKRIHVIDELSEEPLSDIYCEKCEISFASQSAFDEHLSQSKLHEEHKIKLKPTTRRKRDILPITPRCFHCNKKFKSKVQVSEHIAEEHPGQSKVERVVCEICGAVLSSTYIDIHMNRHTRKKVYPCQTCGKQFLCATSHSTHQLTHTGEKPHPCPICPKRFAQKGQMDTHYKRTHLKEPYPKRTYNRKNRNRQQSEMPLFASLLK